MELKADEKQPGFTLVQCIQMSKEYSEEKFRFLNFKTDEMYRVNNGHIQVLSPKHKKWHLTLEQFSIHARDYLVKILE